MRVSLLAVGRGMPGWVRDGYEEYARRLRRPWSLALTEVRAAAPAAQASPGKAMAEEGERLLKAVSERARIVALDESGRQLSTAALARQWRQWSADGAPLALLVGGAEGLSRECRERASFVWSLSSMTLPHMLVRVIVAEQVYRIWSVLNNHPYHREGKPD
jgi:23S rRNA (pseudouridine1915-N3)-methyltransferase